MTRRHQREDAAVDADRDAPPGSPAPAKPSNWNDDGTCKYCGHDRAIHRNDDDGRPTRRKCMNPPPPKSAIFCGCPYRKDTR